MRIVELVDGREILTGAERASRAGDDDRPDIRGVGARPDGRGEGQSGGLVERVHALGAVDRDGRLSIPDVEVDAHRASSFGFG